MRSKGKSKNANVLVNITSMNLGFKAVQVESCKVGSKFKLDDFGYVADIGKEIIIMTSDTTRNLIILEDDGISEKATIEIDLQNEGETEYTIQ